MVTSGTSGPLRFRPLSLVILFIHGEFYDECYLNNCDVCVVRSVSGPLDQ